MGTRGWGHRDVCVWGLGTWGRETRDLRTSSMGHRDVWDGDAGTPSLRFVNRHGGTLRRAGWVAFTKTYSRRKWLISHLPLTFCNNHSHPASPASLFLTSPRLHPTRPRIPYLMSSSPLSRVPRSQVPTHASRCPRPTFIHCLQNWCYSFPATTAVLLITHTHKYTYRSPSKIDFNWLLDALST